MNDCDAIQFYGMRLVDAARSMPLREMMHFLHGALAVAGDHTALDPIREAYIQIRAGDTRLELISCGSISLENPPP